MKKKKAIEKPTTTAEGVANGLVRDYIDNKCYCDSIKQFHIVGYTAAKQEPLVELSEKRIAEILEWLETCEFVRIEDDAYYYIIDCKGCSIEQTDELADAIWGIAHTISCKTEYTVGDTKITFDSNASLGVHTLGKTIVAGFIKSQLLGALFKESEKYVRALGGKK